MVKVESDNILKDRNYFMGI